MTKTEKRRAQPQELDKAAIERLVENDPGRLHKATVTAIPSALLAS